jgi:hypothetical protein
LRSRFWLLSGWGCRSRPPTCHQGSSPVIRIPRSRGQCVILATWRAQCSKERRLVARVAMTTDFEPGDFVRLKISPTGRVGVVNRVDPESSASVRVYWHRGLGLSMTDAYEPSDCDLSLRKMSLSTRSH